ncbi:hypothetical protein EKK58_07635 [Candidatus Dependentiae bacterium]|nr:MAG: hypothetical protein EKK58_07635 [Candidatus Dependentiae bacterium]
MTSKAALLNLLREKGDEQLDHIIQFADHKPKIYKKMLVKQAADKLKLTESAIEKPVATLVKSIIEEPVEIKKEKKSFFSNKKHKKNK